MDERFIHCCIRCKISGQLVLTTFVYGFHSIFIRRPLQGSIKELGESISDPWMVIDDFNALLSAQDKVGGLPVKNYELQDLERVVHCCNLVDLQSIACHLTQTNGTVSCKLDQWLMEDFLGYAEFLVPGCLSDHSCCVVSLLWDEHRVQWPFKFYNMWALYEDFQDLVTESWMEPINGTAQFILKQKLTRLKSRLRALNKQHFQHILQQALRAKQE